MYVAKPEFLKLVHHPIFGHAIVRRAGDTAPILIAVLAALSRDGGDLTDRRLDLHRVDIGIGFVAGRQRKADVFLILDVEIFAVLGQAERTPETPRGKREAGGRPHSLAGGLWRTLRPCRTGNDAHRSKHSARA